MLEVVIIVRLE